MSDRIGISKQMFEKERGVHMDQEEKLEVYKQELITMIETSGDIDYIVAVYSFARGYPDKTKRD